MLHDLVPGEAGLGSAEKNWVSVFLPAGLVEKPQLSDT